MHVANLAAFGLVREGTRAMGNGSGRSKPHCRGHRPTASAWTWRITVVAALALCQINAGGAQMPDPLPLQVGNWWRYECKGRETFLIGSTVCSLERDFNVESELIVSDSGRLQDRFEETGWYDELPWSEKGTTYHVVSGQLVRVLLNAYPAPATELISEGAIRAGPRTVLGDNIRTVAEDRRPVVWLRAVRSGERWFIYESDLLLWDPFTVPQSDGAYWFTPLCAKPTGSVRMPCEADPWFPGIWSFHVDGTRSLEVPAGYFPESHTILASGTFANLNIQFVAGLGIIQVGDPGLQLAEAMVGGVRYPGPTAATAAGWARVKRSVLHTTTGGSR